MIRRRGRSPGRTLLVLLGGSIGCDAAAGPAELPQLRLEEVARFGSADGALSLQYIGTVTLSAGSGDTLLLTQVRVPSVLILTAAGDSIGVLGRRGEGPGELMQPGAVAIRGDTVWVGDGPTARIGRYGLGGAVYDGLQPRPQPLGIAESAPYYVAPLPDGTLLYRGSVYASPADRGRPGMSGPALVRVSREGRVVDSLLVERTVPPWFRIAVTPPAFVTGLHPLSDDDRIAVDPMGRWVVLARTVTTGGQPTAELRWIGMDGRTLHERSVVVGGVPAGGEREAWIDEMAVAHPGVPRARVASAIEEQVWWPELVPPVTALLSDDSGRLWVRTPHPDQTLARWLLFDERGEPLGSAELLRGMRVLAALGETVWGSSSDFDDVPYLYKYRLVD